MKFVLPLALILLLAACSVPSQGGKVNTSAVSISTESASAGDGQKTRIWLTNFFN